MHYRTECRNNASTNKRVKQLLNKHIVLDETATIQVVANDSVMENETFNILWNQGCIPNSMTVRVWTGPNIVMFAYELNGVWPEVVTEEFKDNYYFKPNPEFRQIKALDDLTNNKSWEFGYFLTNLAKKMANSEQYQALFPVEEPAVLADVAVE